MKIQSLIKEFDSLFSISLLSPLYKCLKVHEVGALGGITTVVGFVDLINKLELLVSIIQLVLSDPAVYHADQWGHVALI